MAVYTWTGTTNTAWDNNGNWDVGGSFPDGSGDDAIFSGGAVNCLSIGTPVTIGALRIGADYTGTIGVSGGTAVAVSGAILDFSAGAVGHHLDGAWTSVDVNDSVSSTSTPALTMSGSQITTLSILGGNGSVSVLSSSTVTTVTFINARFAKLTLGASGAEVSGLANITMDSGAITRYGDVSAEVKVLGGVFSDFSGTTVLMSIYDGDVSHKSSDTLTTLIVYGGVFDGSENMNASTIVTNATLYEGGRISLMSGLENYTLTNGLVFNGGTFTPDKGTTWDIS